MSRALVLVGAASVLLWGAPSSAVVIDFVPSDQTVALGTDAFVDLVISGLGDFTAPSLGAFDLDVTYDAAILSPQSVNFTPRLGDGTLGQSIEGLDVSIPGLIDFFIVSLLSQQELEILQPESFVLATFSFQAIAPGTSPLVLTQVLLGDALGADLVASAGSGRITVTGSGSGVPEPAPAGLLFAAVLGLATLRLPSLGRFLPNLSSRAQRTGRR